MTRSKKPNNASKDAARQYQRDNPGTPYPVAKRAVTRPVQHEYEFVAMESPRGAHLAAYRRLDDAALFKVHLDTAEVSVALAFFAEREDQMGFVPLSVSDAVRDRGSRIDAEKLETLIVEGLWTRVSGGYWIRDDETLAFARAGIQDWRDDYHRQARICEERRHHIVRDYPVGSDDEGNTFCEDCWRCVCAEAESCEFPHTTNELILADHYIAKAHTGTAAIEDEPEPTYRAVPV